MFFKYLPPREVDIKGYLGDIESHLPEGHPYKDRNKITWAHEGTHGINAQIRNDNQVKVGSAYLLNNLSWTMPKIDSITLQDVAEKVPIDIIGKQYKLYLIDAQEWWNDNPLYLIDELSAYLNGTRVGIQLQMNAKYSCARTIEMFGYSGTLLNMLEDKQKDELKELLIHINIEIKTLLFTYDELKDYYREVFEYIKLHEIVY